jgi:lipid II:glycine glycyltransferase (peptidoglycan interpeptide bridge formation enzyme)
MGDAADLATFHRLHVGTAQRQTFLPLPEAYFAHMWRVLHPLGHLQLFLTKYNHEPVSGMLVICFGDTAHAEYFGWSGRWQKCRPNEVLCWSMIQWAKSQGYHYFNMGWINPQVAQTIESGGKLSESLNHTPASFKLGFSKQIFRFPGSYDRVYSPITGWACRLIVPKFANSSSLRNVMARIL